MNKLPPIVIPAEFNYIAAFLTFSCQLRCVYCINHHGGDLVKGRRMETDEWIRGLNRIETRADLPITIQGGEPTTYKGFYDVVNGIKPEIPLDLLTNLEVDCKRFRDSIRPERFSREAKYASIRVSYHHGQSDFAELIQKVVMFKELGYSIGIWEVDHPEYHVDAMERQFIARRLEIDYRLKEFLGPWKGVNYGTMRYSGAVNGYKLRHCECKTSELLIGPDGHIFRCHSDLYADRSAIGHILDPEFGADALGNWAYCGVYGKCNSCDIKVKTDRFQEYGHSSVEIRGISEPYAENTPVVDVVNTYGKK